MIGAARAGLFRTFGPSAPVNIAAPTLSGTAQEGKLLTSSTGTWLGAPTSYAYQWLNDGVPIAGATAASYMPRWGDIGDYIACHVTATNAGGSSSATSGVVFPIVAGALVWNTNDRHAEQALTNSDRTATTSSFNQNRKVRSNSAKASGAWYVEVTCTGVGGEDYPIVGFATAAETFANQYLGESSTGCGYVRADGSLRYQGSTRATGPAYYNGYRLGLGYNFETGQFRVHAGGSSYVATFTPFSAPIYLCFNGFNAGDGFRIETDVSLGLPSGHSHWQ